MGLALVAAARDAGLRIALLDACYLSSGFGAAPEGVQARFTDGTRAPVGSNASRTCRVTGALAARTSSSERPSTRSGPSRATT